jgi:hypothetical protein
MFLLSSHVVEALGVRGLEIFSFSFVPLVFCRYFCGTRANSSNFAKVLFLRAFDPTLCDDCCVYHGMNFELLVMECIRFLLLFSV